MNNTWLDSLEEKTYNFILSLKKDENSFAFYPTKEGLTDNGSRLNLGFSCFALKTYFILDVWKDLSEKDITKWVTYINNFQKNKSSFPQNSYIDDAFLLGYDNLNFSESSKFTIKKIMNIMPNKTYELKDKKIKTSIRAETKQAIASLNEVGFSNIKPYLEFPSESNEIDKFLNSLDWQFPWSSGAQFAGLCVFGATQNYENKSKAIRSLEKFSNKIVNITDGAYYVGKQKNISETINGAMKVLTGLDWIDKEIHYPEKLIDLCLQAKPSQEGCDLVDVVYVLYRCSLQTTYRRKDIIEYFEDIISLIKIHNFNEGGFSYFNNKSQTHYYGLKITNGKNVPDIHGTTLLIWALSMIFKTIENNKFSLNVLKP